MLYRIIRAGVLSGERTSRSLLKLRSAHPRSTPSLVLGIIQPAGPGRQGHIRRKHTNHTFGLVTNNGEAEARRRVEHCIYWVARRQDKAVFWIGTAPTDARDRLQTENRL